MQFVAATNAQTIFLCLYMYLFLLSAYHAWAYRSVNVRRCQLCAYTVKGERIHTSFFFRLLQFKPSSKCSIKDINWFPSNPWDSAIYWAKCTECISQALHQCVGAAASLSLSAPEPRLCITNDLSPLVSVSVTSLLSLPENKASMEPRWGVQGCSEDRSEVEATGKRGRFGVGTPAQVC